MNNHFKQLSEFLLANGERAMQAFIEAAGAEQAEQGGSLLRALADHLASTESRADEGKARQWERGHALNDLIRGIGALRRMVVFDLLDAFTIAHPEFPAEARLEAGRVMQQFFDELVVDATEQFSKAKEGALLASQKNTKGILESALDSIVVMGGDGRVREWNQAAERMFGYSRAEAIGAELAELVIPEELRARHRAGLAHYLKRGEGPLLGKRIEVEAIGAGGRRLLVELAIAPTHSEDDEMFTAYLRDITQRVQTERRREAQYAIASLLAGDAPLSELAPAMLETIAKSGAWSFGTFWLFQADSLLHCHTTWQAEGEDLARFAEVTRSRVFKPGEGVPGGVFATGQAAWLPDAATDSIYARRAEAAASDLHGTLIFPLTGAGGRNGVVELLSHSIAAPDEDLLRLVESLGIQVGLYLERKQTEEELHRQKEAAEAANQAKDRFLATLSHELRTPLTPVLMWACVAAGDEKLDPALREDIRMVCRNVELEARLIDDLLDLTRITQGKLQLKLQICDAHALLEHAVEIVRSEIAAKRIHLEVELSATRHRIQGDPTRIQQVFWNLLKNAQKFTPESGRISVRSFNPGADVLAFEISDSGRGIDRELMPKLFTAFQQGASSGEGLGLGLAICKAIVEKHGGTIFATSDGEGKGARFSVHFSTVPGQGLGGNETSRTGVNPWRKLRILMVEDHEHTALVMSRLLRRGGHEVLTATTVQSALAILSAQHVDLLVSDLGLPDGNGFQVMREVAKRSDAKGIAVSGYGMDEDIAQSSAAGFSVHLTKPISPEQLEQAIKLVTGED